MVGKWEMSQFWGFYTTIVLMVTPHSYFAIMNFNGKTQLQYYAISAGTTFARSIVRSLFLSVKPFLVRIKAALRDAKYGPRWSLCRVVGSGERSSLRQQTVEPFIVDPCAPFSIDTKLTTALAQRVSTRIQQHRNFGNVSLSVLTAIFQMIWVSRYQNVSILDFIGAKDDGGGGDNWSCKMCKAPVNK